MNMTAMLPFLSQEDLQILTQKIIESEKKELQKVSLSQVVVFLDKAYIDDLFLNHLDDKKIVHSLLPFVSEKILYEVVQANLIKENSVDIVSLLPFLDSKTIEEIAYHWIDENKNIHSLLPFLSNQTLHQLVLDYINGTKQFDINDFVPFLEAEDMQLLFRFLIEKNENEKK